MLTLSLGLGIAVSLLLMQVTGISAGGIIAPGYVALMLDRPPALIALAVVAAASWAVAAIAGRYLFLWGARRFGLTILVATLLGLLLDVMRTPLGLAGLGLNWGGLGYIVPGLIAHQIDRQGWIATFACLALAAAIVRLLILMVVQF